MTTRSEINHQNMLAEEGRGHGTTIFDSTNITVQLYCKAVLDSDTVQGKQSCPGQLHDKCMKVYRTVHPVILKEIMVILRKCAVF